MYQSHAFLNRARNNGLTWANDLFIHVIQIDLEFQDSFGF